MDDLRKRALEALEEMVTKAEGVAAGTVPIDPDLEPRIDYAKHLADRATHNIQFALRLEILDWTRDKDTLFNLANRMNAISQLTS